MKNVKDMGKCKNVKYIYIANNENYTQCCKFYSKENKHMVYQSFISGEAGTKQRHLQWTKPENLKQPKISNLKERKTNINKLTTNVIDKRGYYFLELFSSF